MQAGDYGQIDSSILEKYRLECSRLWPQANLFQTNLSSKFDKLSLSTPSPCDSQTNGSETVLTHQN